MGVIGITVAEGKYLAQEVHHDSDDSSYHPSNSRHQQLRAYEPVSHEAVSSGDPKHYQTLDLRYFRQGHLTQPQYHAVPRQIKYHEPEDQSYHRSVPQQVVYHQPEDQSYHRSVPQHVEYHQPEDQSYHRNHNIVYHHVPQGYQTQRQSYDVPQHQSYEAPQRQSYEDPQHQSYEAPQHQTYEAPQHQTYEAPQLQSYEVPKRKESYEVPHEPKEREEDAKYAEEEHQTSPAPKNSHAPYPSSRVQRDPRLPLYFTMYEKRVIQDPLTKYGKGPWRYLTYGHGITYGSKEPGKVFEKGYGYIRALGRDHCKEPGNICPPRDGKPFQYEGRKEPYFGYRPH